MSVDEYSEQLSPPPHHLPLENLLHDKNTNITILRATRYKIHVSHMLCDTVRWNWEKSYQQRNEVSRRKNSWRENLSHRIQCWAVCVEHLAFVLCKKDEERCKKWDDLSDACGAKFVYVCVWCMDARTCVCVVNAECTHAFVMCKSQIEDDRKGSRLIWHFTVVVLVQVLRIYMRVWKKW